MRVVLDSASQGLAMRLKDIAKVTTKVRTTVLRDLVLAFGKGAIDYSPVVSGNYVYNWRVTATGEYVYDSRYKAQFLARLKSTQFSPLGSFLGNNTREVAKRQLNPDNARGRALANFTESVASVTRDDVNRIVVYNMTPYADDVERRHAPMFAGQIEAAYAFRTLSGDSTKKSLLARARAIRNKLR